MSATVTKLPTASSSFYEFRQKKPGLWVVDLVTPSIPRALRTTLVSGYDRQAVLESARDSASRTNRPLQIKKGA
jgi:hypothetical protein